LAQKSSKKRTVSSGVPVSPEKVFVVEKKEV
jgi:hypothetical protein